MIVIRCILSDSTTNLEKKVAKQNRPFHAQLPPLFLI